jgi:hypothetical protein
LDDIKEEDDALQTCEVHRIEETEHGQLQDIAEEDDALPKTCEVVRAEETAWTIG